MAQGPQHATLNVRHVRICCIMCFTRDLEEIIIRIGFSLKYALCMSCIEDYTARPPVASREPDLRMTLVLLLLSYALCMLGNKDYNGNLSDGSYACAGHGQLSGELHWSLYSCITRRCVYSESRLILIVLLLSHLLSIKSEIGVTLVALLYCCSMRCACPELRIIL